MKNIHEVMNFFDVAIKTGSQIASDHGASKIKVHYGSGIEHLPPSFGSGVGQLTESLFFTVVVSFEPTKRPVTRTRKFTMYNADHGVEVWPSGEMSVSDSECRFVLRAGNATNPGWGVFASFRNGRLTTLVDQLAAFEANPPLQHIQAMSVLPVDDVRTFSL